jgi:hypothetical protein
MYKVYKGVDQGCCLGEHLNVLGIEMKFRYYILLRNVCLIGMILEDRSSLGAGFV